MRHEPDHRPVLYGLPVMQPFDADEPHDPLFGRPPQDAALEYGASERLEVTPQETPALRFARSRKAQPQIRETHAPALGRDDVRAQAESASQRREQRERQEMQQPHEGERVRRRA